MISIHYNVLTCSYDAAAITSASFISGYFFSSRKLDYYALSSALVIEWHTHRVRERSRQTGRKSKCIQNIERERRRRRNMLGQEHKERQVRCIYLHHLSRWQVWKIGRDFTCLTAEREDGKKRERRWKSEERASERGDKKKREKIFEPVHPSVTSLDLTHVDNVLKIDWWSEFTLTYTHKKVKFACPQSVNRVEECKKYQWPTGDLYIFCKSLETPLTAIALKHLTRHTVTFIFILWFSMVGFFCLLSLLFLFNKFITLPFVSDTSVHAWVRVPLSLSLSLSLSLKWIVSRRREIDETEWSNEARVMFIKKSDKGRQKVKKNR